MHNSCRFILFMFKSLIIQYFLRISVFIFLLIVMSLTISLNYGWCDPEPEFLPHGVFVASLGLNTQLADSLVSTVGQLRAGVFSFIEINVDSILADESVTTKVRLLKENI